MGNDCVLLLPTIPHGEAVPGREGGGVATWMLDACPLPDVEDPNPCYYLYELHLLI
jgi:hypothetical protein